MKKEFCTSGTVETEPGEEVQCRVTVAASQIVENRVCFLLYLHLWKKDTMFSLIVSHCVRVGKRFKGWINKMQVDTFRSRMICYISMRKSLIFLISDKSDISINSFLKKQVVRTLWKQSKAIVSFPLQK